MLAFLGGELPGFKSQVCYISVTCWFVPAQLPLPMRTCCDFLLGCRPSPTLGPWLWEGPAMSLLLWGRTGLLWAPGEQVTGPNQHSPSPSHSDWFKRRH